MNIKIESKMVVETTGYFHDGELKTAPCELSGWYGDEICKIVDFNSEIEKMTLPEGEYNITITLEKVNS